LRYLLKGDEREIYVDQLRGGGRKPEGEGRKPTGMGGG